jgi:hypothetical protein
MAAIGEANARILRLTDATDLHDVTVHVISNDE